RAVAVPLPQREAEDVSPLEEERPLLLEEDLAGAEVDLRRIRLHLAEVRVDGAGQGEARAEPGLEIEPGARQPAGAVAERIAAGRRLQADAAEQVRQQLQARARRHPAQTDQGAVQAD